MRGMIDFLITIVWFIWSGAFLPQIYMVWKRKSAADLSIFSFGFGFCCSVASLAYGIYINLWPRSYGIFSGRAIITPNALMRY